MWFITAYEFVIHSSCEWRPFSLMFYLKIKIYTGHILRFLSNSLLIIYLYFRQFDPCLHGYRSASSLTMFALWLIKKNNSKECPWSFLSILFVGYRFVKKRILRVFYMTHVFISNLVPHLVSLFTFDRSAISVLKSIIHFDN